MRSRLSHILFMAVLLASLFACQKKALDGDSVPAEEPVETRIVTLDLNISALAPTRAGTDSPLDLDVWVYGDDGSAPLKHVDFVSVNWSEAGNSGDVDFFAAFNAVEIEVAVAVTKLKVYAVANAGKASWINGESAVDPETGFAGLSETELKGLSFGSVAADATDNTVPMYGAKEISIQNGEDHYSAVMDMSRCVGKIELFFTRGSEAIDLDVKSISLSGIPEKGYLVKPEDFSTISISSVEGVLMSGTETVTAVLGRDAVIGSFSSKYENDRSCFNDMTIAGPYLFERGGLTWDKTGSDDKYPDGSAADAYGMKIEYVQDGVSKTDTILLSRVDRNTVYRIFIRVSEDQALEVNTVAVPWVEGEGGYVFDVSPDFDDIVGEPVLPD